MDICVRLFNFQLFWSADNEISGHLIDYFTAFAHGNISNPFTPYAFRSRSRSIDATTTSPLQWQEFNSTTRLYLEFGDPINHLSMRADFRSANCRFWDAFEVEGVRYPL